MEIIKFKKLENKEIPLLLKTIKKIKKETKNHDKNIDSFSYWNWKYKELPSKKSLVFVATYKKNIIGYYHIPIYDFNIQKKKYKIGSIQSVAVLKKYRKKNIFRNLSIFANNEANKDLDLIYTFPNDKSIHTFLRYNKFTNITNLPFYIYPIKSGELLKSKVNFYGFNLAGKLVDTFFNLFSLKLNKNEKVIEFKKINKEIINLFSKFSNEHKLFVNRNSSFINWRFGKFSKYGYKIFGIKKNNVLKAIVIIKIDTIFNCKGIIVMDFAFREFSDFNKLLKNLSNLNNLYSKSLSFILLSAITKDMQKFRNFGFIKVPRAMVPRNLNLLARSTNQKISKLLKDKKSWLITLSDWDVF